MKRKRLDRDGWGFQGFPYYQMRVELPEFRGLASVIRILSGEDCCWNMPKAGRFPVCGEGMMWLQLVPDGMHHVLTVKYRRQAPLQKIPRVAVWYADVIERIEVEPDGVAAFVDQYLDVIFSPQGDIHIDDREELDAALASGELTADQHARALAEGENIVRTLCADVRRTEAWCGGILQYVLTRLDAADTLRRNA
ncbi:MAG: DUF402 domain-containing protein [Clostridia bacterium]|nr:DUF402 domain-containing protein [Clostridia bacterium]